MTPGHFAEILSRYAASFAGSLAWVTVALFVGGCFSLGLLWPRARRWASSTWLYVALVTSLLGCAAAWALHLGWVADDAFISFRYARNWVNGLGLVYNAGERVEGYTNFLWVALLAPFELSGLYLPVVSTALTILCQAATLLVVAHLSRRVCARQERSLPIAAVLLGMSYVFASFATSGMETMLGTLLVLTSVERASKGHALSAGTLGILATMTHPDHAIFYAALGASLWLSGAGRRALGRFLLPFGLLYVPYFLLRWSYYGDFFPNTYYAKNASLFYFSQGAVYLVVSSLSTGLWVALPLAALGAWRHRQHLLSRFTALAAPVFLLYVAKIGGDFMLGRLLCPLLPPVFVLAELGLRSLARGGARARFASASSLLLLSLVSLVPAPIARPREKFLHVADERTFYEVQSYAPFSMKRGLVHEARSMKKVFTRLSRPPVLALGAIGAMGYETGVRLVDNYGLVNRDVAHGRTRRRGRPGHEKHISPGQLLVSGADLSHVPVYPPEYWQPGKMSIGGFAFHLVRYDAELFSSFERSGVGGPPLLEYLDSYSPPRGPGSEALLDCDLWHAEHVYFQTNRDEHRRKRIVERVIARRPDWEGYEDFVLGEPDGSSAQPWEEVAAMSFDSRGDWATSGTAFVDSPAFVESAGQESIVGARGGFLNSYVERNGDRAVGTLESRPFEIRGEVITLQVGGGRFPKKVFAQLVVDGQTWFSATGCNSSILGRRTWVTRALLGSRARLRVVDRRRGGWGHLIVDDVVQWKRRAPSGPSAVLPASAVLPRER